MTLATAGAVVALAAWAGYDTLRDRQETAAAAFRNAGNLADALAGQAAGTMDGIAKALTGLVDAIPPAAVGQDDRRPAIFDLLSERQKANAGVYAFLVLDGSGRLVHSSRSRRPRPVDFAQAPWFAEAAAQRGEDVAIGRPALIQIEEGQRAWVVPAYRTVVDQDGRPTAVFVAVLSLDQLGHVHGAFDVGPDGRVSLFRADGLVLATHPFREALLGTSQAHRPLFRDHLALGGSGRFFDEQTFDGVHRLVAYRTVAGHPLVVAVGLEEAWVLAPWRTRTLRALGALGLLVTLVLALAAYARRMVRLRTAAMAEQTRRLNLLAGASIGLARSRSATAMLDAAAGIVRSLVGAHQSVVSVTPEDGGPTIIHAVSLSDRYAAWRTYDEAPTGAGIYALVGETNRPMRMTQAELEAHPAWKGFGAAAGRHPPMRGWLAVPIVGQDGRNIGIIQLSDRNEGEFDEADEAICLQFSLMLAALIENLRSGEALADALAAEREARAEADRLRRRTEIILASISDAFFVLDRSFRFRHLNDRAAAALGGRDLIGRRIWDAFPPAVDTPVKANFEHAMEHGEPVAFVVYYPPFRAWFDVRASPFEEGLSVYFRDVTEKIETEAKLQQAQKMEAVGQLTGGIAHDFNNLLTVILGMGDAILAAPIADPALREKIETIVAAGERGAQLTSSLLAFSRRHPLEPRATDIGQLIGRSEALLSRTLGERIEIEAVTSGSLWRAMVDPGQLELAILNLAINARDAMPNGGRLTIEAANARLDEAYAQAHPEVSAGQYVMVAVSDTGTGMTAETIARAFEPFFTTKPVGKGSGLGLSMVYGFVKQSGGHVSIYSEVGAGTTIKLYLPRAVERPAERAGSEPEDRAPGGSEAILVVEDTAEVRRLIVDGLAALGYRVTTAQSGAAALGCLEGARFDLLLTDVMLPGGMNGRELAEEARRRQPGLAVLYTSGYTENAIVHHGRLDPGVRLLRKPFRQADLARMVRVALADGR
ncbi:ATP-binding protein [Stella sp.]|uniref:ATP-binding protein n=1 Tax=Stella sp. TaxID=2912054 RepID=UPI0035ADA0D6